MNPVWMNLFTSEKRISKRSEVNVWAGFLGGDSCRNGAMNLSARLKMSSLLW